MVHSEQMNTLDGPIRIATSSATRHEQIENHSTFELHSVCLVKRNGGQLEGRWIGDLLPGQSSTLTLRSVPAKKTFAQERADDTRLQRGEQLNIEPLFRLALDPANIEDGETRLVARVNEVLPGETITPTASQVRGATLVVAHLQYAPLPPPEKTVTPDKKSKIPNPPTTKDPSSCSLH